MCLRLNTSECLTLGDVTTVNLTMLKGGVAYNVIPSEMDITFDLRIPPTVNLQVRDLELLSAHSAHSRLLLCLLLILLMKNPPQVYVELQLTEILVDLLGVRTTDQNLVQRSRWRCHLWICSGQLSRAHVCSVPVENRAKIAANHCRSIWIRTWLQPRRGILGGVRSVEPAGKCEYIWTMSSEPLNQGFFSCIRLRFYRKCSA